MGIAGRIVSRAEGLDVPIWLLLILIISFGSLRGYLEIALLNYSPHYIISFLQTSCSYYLMMFMFVFLALKAITGEKTQKIVSALSVAVPVILIPPIVDRFIFNRTMPYEIPSSHTWANMTLSFFQSNPASFYRGHQVEFAIFLALIFFYICVKLHPMKKVQRAALSLGSTFVIYVAIMAISTPEIWPIYWILYIPYGSGFTEMYPDIAYNFVYVVLASIFFWLAIIIENPAKVKKLMADASPPRIIHFSLMYVLGFCVQLDYSRLSKVYYYGNALTLLIGVLSAASGWAFVVAINNYYDKKEDEITNTFRGLSSGEYTEINLMRFSILALVTGAYTSLLLGIMPTVFYLSFVFLGFLYSYPKIYLKKYGTKTIIIGLGSALLFGMGYFSPWLPNLSPPDARFWIYFTVLFIVFSAGSVMNDLKDVESDRLRGTITVFTLLGRKRGKIFGAALMLVAFSLPAVLAPAIAFVFFALAIIGALLLIKEKVLYIYFVYFSEYFLILLFHSL